MFEGVRHERTPSRSATPASRPAPGDRGSPRRAPRRGTRRVARLNVRIPLAGLAGLMLLVLARPAAAQEESALPSDIIRADSALTAAQEQVVASYVQRWATALASSARITDARSNLIAPLKRPGASPIFKTAYSDQVLATEPFERVSESDDLLLRLNAAIIVSEMSSAAALAKAMQMLQDESPAVRYWAARAIGSLLARLELDEAVRRQELQKLRTALAREASEEAAAEIFTAIIQFRSAEAIRAVLEAVRVRVERHRAEPQRSVDNITDALIRLSQTLVLEPELQSPPIVRLLMVDAFLFVQLIADQMLAGEIPERQQPAARRLVVEFDKVLRFWSTRAGLAADALPANVAQLAARDNWEEIILAIEDWRRVLTERLEIDGNLLRRP